MHSRFVRSEARRATMIVLATAIELVACGSSARGGADEASDGAAADAARDASPTADATPGERRPCGELREPCCDGDTCNDALVCHVDLCRSPDAGAGGDGGSSDAGLPPPLDGAAGHPDGAAPPLPDGAPAMPDGAPPLPDGAPAMPDGAPPPPDGATQ
jgi:hypothetical protein